MFPFRTDATMRMVVAVVLVLFSPGQGARGLQVSPPAGGGGTTTPRNCEAERDDKLAKAKRAFDFALVDIRRQFDVDVKRCQDMFDIVDVPACLDAYEATMRSLLGQALGTAPLCAAVCAASVVPPLYAMAPACISCIGAATVGICYQADQAARVKANCVKTAERKAQVCGESAYDQAQKDMESAMDALRIAVAEAVADYQRCKASAGG